MLSFLVLKDSNPDFSGRGLVRSLPFVVGLLLNRNIHAFLLAASGHKLYGKTSSKRLARLTWEVRGGFRHLGHRPRHYHRPMPQCDISDHKCINTIEYGCVRLIIMLPLSVLNGLLLIAHTTPY